MTIAMKRCCFPGFMLGIFSWACVTWLVLYVFLEDKGKMTVTYPITTFSESRFDDNFPSWDQHDNVTGFLFPIVPNIVHFIKFHQHNLTLVQMVVILAAWCHQRPDRIIIHCDCDDLIDPYWPRIKWLSGVEVQRIQQPTEVFGKPLSKQFNVFHAGDVARIAVLQQYGGIALDFDTYIVRSLNEFRHFECTVGWPEKDNIGCQIILAHRKARFLQMYSDSYHSYRPNSWYYNAGQLPTRILELFPHIVHRVPWKLGIHYLRHKLFNMKWKEWRSYYSIHLLIRWADRSNKTVKDYTKFDDFNIRDFPFTFGNMARLVMFGSEEIISDNRTVNWNYNQCRRKA